MHLNEEYQQFTRAQGLPHYNWISDDVMRCVIVRADWIELSTEPRIYNQFARKKRQTLATGSRMINGINFSWVRFLHDWTKSDPFESDLDGGLPIEWILVS